MQEQLSVNDNDDQSQSQRAIAIDRHVGSRLRERRVMLGLSQQQLAGRIGVTYQQAHKYERGLNRISAGRLFTIARTLDVDPSWFFDGMQQDEIHEPAPRQRMALELARNFSLIKNELHQEALSQMARSLASEGRLKVDNHSQTRRGCRCGGQVNVSGALAELGSPAQSAPCPPHQPPWTAQSPSP